MKKRKIIDKIFEKDEALTRKALKDYLSQKKDANKVERRALKSSFESDALSGFVSMGADISDMSTLDKKFKTSYKGWLPVVSLFAVLFSALFVFIMVQKGNYENTTKTFITEEEGFYDNFQSETPSLKAKEENEMSTDASIADSFGQEEVLSFQNTGLKEDKSEQLSVNMVGDMNNEEAIAKLPIRSIQPNFDQTRKLKLKLGPQLYLHDFKVIDYRNIRNDQGIQLKLLGTPADNGMNNDEVAFSVRKSDIAYMDYLGEGLAALKRLNYSLAQQYFETILSHFSEDRNAHFYLAYIAYKSKNLDKAKRHFEQAYDYELMNFYEEANWFIVQIFIADKQYGSAKELLESIINQNGFYASKAKELLGKI